MNKNIVERKGHAIAVLHYDSAVITDTQTALDLMMELSHEDRCNRMALNKEAFHDSFFDLSTGLAGEVLQKFTQYSMKLAIVGDFSVFESRALRDLIFECNRGNDVFFVDTDGEAVSRLSEAM